MTDESNNGLPPEIFQELLKKYKESLPERMNGFNHAIQLLKKNPSKENLTQVRFFVHKFAGNAGTYGYQTVTDLCKSWDAKLSEMMNQFPNCKLDESLFNELDALFKKIQEQFSHGK
ncbi:MAG: hypothetical protein COT85_06795 [Chlamydiae bacterium CG10_big_fil_rev_8_21_14_0_10_42_34]|nr:MAG: hypothetical protein COT85_06795 [Chlamydiae bacterium CG10_big_fil_rev_8_21_14_0_10_42_34]